MSSKPTSSSPSDLAPARFILSPAEVAGCFAVLGAAPPDAQLYAGLPEPATSLPNHVRRGKAKLVAEAECLFRVLAAPTQSINVSSYRPGSPVSIEARFACDGADGPYAMLSIDEAGDWDLALLTARDQLMAILDDLCGLTAGPAQDSGFSVRLSTKALTALAAIADRLSEDQLQSRLARVPDLMSVAAAPIDLTDLTHMTELGLDRPDTRAVVTLMALVSAGAIAGDRSLEVLEAGVRELGASGLVDAEGRVTTVGLGVASALSEAQVVSSLIVMATDGRDVTVDWLMLIRAPGGLLLGVWDGPPGRAASLVLSDVAADTAFAIVDDSLAGSASGRARAASAPKVSPASPAGKARSRAKAAAPKAAAARPRRSKPDAPPRAAPKRAKRAAAGTAATAKSKTASRTRKAPKAAVSQRRPGKRGSTTKSRRPASAAAKHCVKCGAKLGRGKKFCTQCGHRI
ncbi:MAG: zinc ribbon domain-containing protein [Alphaproteobacteria bacterium]|nr:zinc ribbon domain-containing protein [Alphaproteobacteria bacterium]